MFDLKIRLYGVSCFMGLTYMWYNLNLQYDNDQIDWFCFNSLDLYLLFIFLKIFDFFEHNCTVDCRNEFFILIGRMAAYNLS